jgi:uncharacterized membrane protein YvlD (DUF360 family)
MRHLLKKYLVTIVSIYLLLQLIPSFKINGGLGGLLYSSLILSLLTYMVKPILNLVLLPINVITLNLSSWVLNILIFLLWTILMKNVIIANWAFKGTNSGIIKIDPVFFPSWQLIIILSILFVFLSKFIYWVIH